MMRLLVILALAFFAVTFLVSILKRVIKAGGISGMPGSDRNEPKEKKEDKSKIIDAKYEEIK
jgi:hypothetical protein